MKRRRIRPRSDKMAERYVLRRELVSRLLYERPMCERCKTAPASDVHEIRSRGRGGDMLDEKNCATLCRPCHTHVTAHPAESERDGWLRSRWA